MCGYDHQLRGTKERHVPIDFTSCLAHGEVTYQSNTHRVLLIRGYFEHNMECLTSQFKRAPDLPIHPSVFKVALEQLRAGLTLDKVQDVNRQLYEKRTYPQMPLDLAASPYRWLFTKGDSRSLYRQLHRLNGIVVVEKAHTNVDRWLDPSSRQFNRTLYESVFHYAPRTTKEERFEICIATPEMVDAAWSYSHKSQIILDGTFGICNAKMLLFIVMGVDEKNRGVPLAFLLFSAPSENRHTAAGYDTETITRMLDKWRLSLGERGGETFTAFVAITDTDLIERGALVRVFPSIWLLLCRFHVRQSWRNHRAREVKGTSEDHIRIKDRLRRLEVELIESTNHVAAKSLVEMERRALQALADPVQSGTPEGDAVKGALQHVAYLDSYWLRENLWSGWSQHGRLAAAAILQRPINEVLPTTNHVESFNNVFKHNHLQRHQKNGRRLRVDVLVHVVISKVLPSIYKQRKLEDQEAARRAALLACLPGGENFAGKHQTSRSVFNGPVAWYEPDDTRDRGASDLVQAGQISAPDVDVENNALTFTCYSSLAFSTDPNAVTYDIALGLDGYCTCSCRDFTSRGGFCKHIRAAWARLLWLRQSGLQFPDLVIPRTPEHAYQIRAARMALTWEATVAATSPGPSSEVGPILEAARAIENLMLESSDSVFETDSIKDAEESEYIKIAEDAAVTLSDPPTQLHRVPSSPPPNDLDLPVLRSNAQRSVDEQTIGRALHDLENVAPKLGRLASLLENLHLRPEDQPDRLRFAVMHEDVSSLVTQLQRLMLEDGVGSTPEPGKASASCRVSITPPPPPDRGLKRPFLPPSPEKRAQKRHQSYSTN